MSMLCSQNHHLLAIKNWNMYQSCMLLRDLNPKLLRHPLATYFACGSLALHLFVAPYMYIVWLIAVVLGQGRPSLGKL